VDKYKNWCGIQTRTLKLTPTRYQGMAKPTENHLTAVKRVFQYLKRTINMGLWYRGTTGFNHIQAFAAADMQVAKHSKEKYIG
ncbi:hypothetical protein Tco_1396773, partial [Tanacetum coccineum]